MSVSKRLRYEILRRDNHACRYCGATAPDATLTVDHVTPIALGGGSAPENLVTACVDCNTGKSSSNPDAPLVADISQDAARWLAARKHITATLEVLQTENDAICDAFDAEWSSWKTTYWPDSYDSPGSIPRPDNWQESLNRFIVAGLPTNVLIAAARRALGNEKVRPKDTWRYFCGICWRKVAEVQEFTQRYVEAQEIDGQ